MKETKFCSFKKKKKKLPIKYKWIINFVERKKCHLLQRHTCSSWHKVDEMPRFAKLPLLFHVTVFLSRLFDHSIRSPITNSKLITRHTIPSHFDSNSLQDTLLPLISIQTHYKTHYTFFYCLLFLVVKVCSETFPI